LKVYTRISNINNSSFVCEGLMFNAETNLPIAKNIAVHVWTDSQTKKSVAVPNEFRRLVHKFEGGNAEFLWPTIEV
jgi:acyl-CoA thioesterase FadM